MKKFFAIMLSMCLILLSFSLNANAHPGRTDANGGHTCRTNCEKWGLKYGEYHYHSGQSSSGSSSGSSAQNNSGSGKTSGGTGNGTKKPAYQPANVTVYYNGTKLTFDQDPVIISGTTMVPMRDIFEAVGASIHWDASSQTVTATKGKTEVKITIGNEFAYTNGSQIHMSPAAIIVEGRTMVPLRFVSEAFDALVEWDNDTRTINITSGDK